MVHETYKVRCLDARFDEDSGFLILNCLFLAIDSPRIVCLNKRDFTFRGNPEVPDIEMQRTAMLFRTKKPEFNLVVADDPAKEQLNEDNYDKYVREFTGRISKELDSVSEGLVDEAGQISRKLGRLMDEGKLDVKSLLQNELAIRAKLGGG
jgi:hypothetical protein